MLLCRAGIVSTFGVMPGVIGMHGGLPPSDSFPFSFFTAGITAAAEGMPQDELHITDPKLVAAAQQYNMHAQVGRPPAHTAKLVMHPLLLKR